MSVAVVHPSLNKVGGAEKVCLEVIRTLSEMGYRVTLATIERTEWHSLEERFGSQTRPFDEKYIVKRLPENSLAEIIFTSLFFTPLLLFLRMKSKNRVIVNTYGDLVESIADISYVNAIPMRIAHRFSQSGLPNSFAWRLAGQVYDSFLRFLDRCFAPSVILANSTFIQDVLKKFLDHDSTVVYPPVNLSRFVPFSKLSRRRDRIVTVSRLRPGKNLELIPEIARLVEKADFVLIGVADEASKCTISRLANITRALQVEGHVRLIVNQPASKLVDILTSAKVFLHTQTMEGFGIAVVEAMVAGCVPVVPRSGGPWCDILAQKQGIYGYSYVSIEEAAKAIDTLITDEQLRSEVSAKAIERARIFDESFFRDTVSKTFGKVYRQKCNR